MEELPYVLTKDFVSCVHDHFYFFTATHFHLAASISHFLTATIKYSCFSSNEIHLPSSFSVIHMTVNIKNNVEKDTTLLYFFLSKSPGSHVIFLGCHTCWLSYFILVCLWCRRMVSGSGGERSHDYQIFYNGLIKFPKLWGFACETCHRLWGRPFKNLFILSVCI